MFQITTLQEKGFNKLILKDPVSGSFVEILPEKGAILHGFSVKTENQLLNIIDHYEDAEDLQNNLSSKGFKSCKLSPFACRINNAQFSFAQKIHHFNKFLLGKHALHGILFDAVFTVTDTQTDAEKASATLLYEYRGTEAGFPFFYDCIVDYQLNTGNELRISTTIINRDPGLIPMQDGWHPYFSFGGKIDDLQLEFQSKSRFEVDAEMIPTGKTVPYEEFGSIQTIGSTKLDDCFELNFAECQPMCVLKDPVKNIRLEIHTDKSYPYLQIYTPDHRNSIAIENLSAPPDTFNNGIGLRILAPGERAKFKTTFKIILNAPA